MYGGGVRRVMWMGEGCVWMGEGWRVVWMGEGCVWMGEGEESCGWGCVCVDGGGVRGNIKMSSARRSWEEEDGGWGGGDGD